MNDNKGGPWGPAGGDGGDGDGGSRGPWGQPRKKRPVPPGGNIASLDDFLKRSRARFGGGLPHGDRPYWLYGIGIVLLFWLVVTSFHRVGPQEQGVVSLFGKYSRTVSPGIAMTLPWPVESVAKVDVGTVQRTDVGAADAASENLILTGDRNIIDLAYIIRWRVRDPQLFLYQIKDPKTTVQEVAESAMRAVVATVSLEDAIGAGRGDIEQRVQQLMQATLDRYRSGVRIEGVSIKQSDPPEAVNNAFKEVSAAQQDAQSYMNQARSYAQQVTAGAQGDAAAFDKVYVQYKAAPEVTRRRMYYEAMERVLAKVDKTVVEAPGVNSYLPLPALRRQPEGSER